jgi:hypothetical protein
MENKKSNIILGLDVSTQTIGVCLLEDDGSEFGKILELTHIKPKTPRKTKDDEKIYIKKRIFKEFIQKYKNMGITNVIVEEPLMRSNNINTVSTLLRFNGMVSDCIYEELGVVPQYISSYDARKYSFPELMSIRKYGKDEKQYPLSKIEKEIKDSKFVLFGGYPWMIDKKIVMQGKVSEIFPNIEWIYGKNGELKKENYDATDAYVAVLGYVNKQRYGELNFSSEIISESNDGNGNVEIHYSVKYWDKDETRKTYVNV